MSHIICIASQKGGTGKTTTVVNLAASLSLFEKKTLVVDCDPSGNATTGLGVDKGLGLRSLFDALTGNARWNDVRVETELSGLHVIPASHELSSLENRKTAAGDPAAILRELATTAASEYDYIVIDSPPAMGYLTVCALSAADFLIIPTQRRLFSLEGLIQLLSLIKRVRSHTNPGLKIAGILFTLVESQWRETNESVPDFLIPLKDYILQTIIPWDTMLADASDFGKPGVLHDIASPGTKAYLELAEEIHHKLSAITQK